MSESITPIFWPEASRRVNNDPQRNIVGASIVTRRSAKRVSSPLFIQISSSVLRCESGKRSIHALVRVDAASKSDWDGRIGAIKPLLITLGADRGALSAVRLTRLPQAKRGERVQRLLYLNPAPDGAPIIRMRNVRDGA